MCDCDETTLPIQRGPIKFKSRPISLKFALAPPAEWEHHRPNTSDSITFGTLKISAKRVVFSLANHLSSFWNDLKMYRRPIGWHSLAPLPAGSLALSPNSRPTLTFNLESSTRPVNSSASFGAFLFSAAGVIDIYFRPLFNTLCLLGLHTAIPLEYANWFATDQQQFQGLR